jgi:FemAB-related protein (PEP-CTERM system-associated)
MMDTTTISRLQVQTLGRADLAESLPALRDFLARRGVVPLSYDPGWLGVLDDAMSHRPYGLVATEGGRIRGFLALSFVKSQLWGRFLVSLPYLNYGGPIADDERSTVALIDEAVALADRLDVRYLELRQEAATNHPELDHVVTSKVQMRLALPPTVGKLWDSFDPKVRNQIRKGQKAGLSVAWGGEELLGDFHHVFSRNMRDLGTPSYGRSLFRETVRQFAGRAEFCVVRAGSQAIAGAILLHGWGVTEVPSASSLRTQNHTNCNMLMYYHLISRAVEKGQEFVDFGRSTLDSNTYRFKSQWGAVPSGSAWQYDLRKGGLKDARPDNPRYQRMIRIWQRLPVAVTRIVGPVVVRGIP